MHWTPGDPLELHVSGFTLRSLRVADVSRPYLHWLKDPAVSRYQNSRFENTCLSDLRDFVAGHDNDSSFLLGIFDQCGDQHIGNHRAVCDLDHQRAHIGVMIGDRRRWGEDIVRKTRGALLAFLFDVRGMYKVCGSVYADNAASVYNYQRLGFEAEAIRASHVVSDGKRGDLIEFALFKDSWTKHKERMT